MDVTYAELGMEGNFVARKSVAAGRIVLDVFAGKSLSDV